MLFNFNHCCDSVNSKSSVTWEVQHSSQMRERPELMSVLAVRARLGVSNGSCWVSSRSVKSTKELEHVRLSYDFLNNSWAGPFAYSLSSALSQWRSVSLSLVKQYPLPKASCDCSRSSTPYQRSPEPHPNTLDGLFIIHLAALHTNSSLNLQYMSMNMQQVLLLWGFLNHHLTTATFYTRGMLCVFAFSRFQVKAILNWLVNIKG